MMDVTADYLALRRDVGVVPVERDVVLVHGPEAEDYLQGQLSQDVVALAVGETRWSLLLEPQGKISARLRVTRRAPDAFVLDVTGGWGDHVVARLERFKLRTAVELEPLAWRSLSYRGPETSGVDVGPAEIIVAAGWPGIEGVDVLGPDVEPAPGVRVCGSDAHSAVRIEAGVPEMGHELDDTIIPAEAGVVADAVSFTKGCYTGQELVARIDSRGSNTPRRLRGVVVGTNVLPPVGAELMVAGKVVGRLTSVAESLDLRAPVGLAYVGRAVEPPAEVEIVFAGQELPAQVRELPLLG